MIRLWKDKLFSTIFVILVVFSNFSDAKNVLVDEEKIESFNDVLKQVQDELKEIKAKLHPLEVSNLMLKLQIHEVKDDFKSNLIVYFIKTK